MSELTERLLNPKFVVPDAHLNVPAALADMREGAERIAELEILLDEAISRCR